MEDNQLSYQRLYYWEETKKLEFVSYRDIHSRDHIVKDDPIVKYRFIVDQKTFQHGIALRRSGIVDLYYN